MAEARRRRAVLLLLAGALGLAVVGCASDYRYVNNSQEKAFFRLPADVEVFRVRTEEPTVAKRWPWRDRWRCTCRGN